MKVSFKIEGLKELSQALTDEMPKATATNVQKRALKVAGEPMVDDAKQKAPYETGLLKKRITISTKLSPYQKGQHKKESKVEMFVGPPSMTRAIVAEFGSVNQSPQPFMRPAWDGNKRTAFSNIREILAEEIEKARKRALRKTARLLAKTKT